MCNSDNKTNYATIKDQSKEFQINFIENVMNQTEIPPCLELKKKNYSTKHILSNKK